MLMRVNATHVYQVIGYKNRGKTNLVCRLIDYWTKLNIKVATVKHDAHSFEIDRDGSDTWLHRHSGAVWTAITSDNGGTAIIQNKSQPLHELINKVPSDAIVLVEGFKFEPYSKLILIKSEEDIQLVNQVVGITAAVLWPEMRDHKEVRGLQQLISIYDRDDTEGIAQHISTVLNLPTVLS